MQNENGTKMTMGQNDSLQNDSMQNGSIQNDSLQNDSMQNGNGTKCRYPN